MRFITGSLAVAGVLTVVAFAVNAQTPSANQGARPHSNQVFVKIIWPAAPVRGTTKRPVVESWIAKQLKNQGQTNFTAATDWVPLDVDGELSSQVWDGTLDGKRWVCSVNGGVANRADGRAEVVVDGWGPAHFVMTVTLADEPGSRAIKAVEPAKTDQGLPYVAVLISPAVPEFAQEAGAVHD